jgi:putative transposase
VWTLPCFCASTLASASPDLLREMVKTFADALMSAEADTLCGAAYGERSEERTNSRNCEYLGVPLRPVG